MPALAEKIRLLGESNGYQMAGVKGRSGGRRPGAGRKPKVAAPAPQCAVGDDPMLAVLRDIALGKVDATSQQVAAAVAVLRFTRVPPAAAGKKAQRQEAARNVVGGRFKPSAPPKLALVK